MIEDFDKQMFKKCMPHFSNPPVVFDIGAHEGLYTKFVLETIQDADCYLFEPNKELAKRNVIRKHLFSFAICDYVGVSPFYTCPEANDELSSVYKRQVFNQTGFTETMVPCITVDCFSLDHDIEEIDFLKVDVEGAELDVLKGCRSMMKNKKIKFIQLEYGGTYKDSGITFKQVIETAAWFGYSVYELVNDTLIPVTPINFVEDYRYTVFLLTYIKCS